METAIAAQKDIDQEKTLDQIRTNKAKAASDFDAKYK